MKETDKIYPADKGEEELLHNVRHILQEARAKVIHHVNSTVQDTGRRSCSGDC